MTNKTCRAVVFGGDGTYELRDNFQIPQPPKRGAVLKVEAVGMCGSDLAQFHGHRHVPGEKAPLVPGHEIVGRVHALDEASNLGVKVGDRVAVDLVLRTEVSPENPFGLSGVYGYTWGIDDDHGLFGGYGEYMAILADTQLLKMTEDIAAEELTIFEPLASVVHWMSMCWRQPGESVLIQGPGHMGLVFLAEAKRRGSGQVIVSGTQKDAHRLEVAKELGADFTIDVESEDLYSRVAEITNNNMVDLAVDLAADTTATVKACLDLTRQGGRILLAGLKNFSPVELISDLIVLKGLTVYGGPGSTPESMQEAVDILNSGLFPTKPLLGATFGLDEIDEAFKVLDRTSRQDFVRVGLVHSV